MIRKLVLKISPSPLVLHVAQLADDQRRGVWPATWSELGAAVRATASIIQAETDQLIETLQSIHNADGVATVFGEETEKEPTILSTLGLGAVIVTVDIPTLFADAERAIDATRGLYKLIQQLARDSHFLCTIRLGTQNVDEAEALDVLADQARERGFLLDDRVMRSSEDHSDVFRDALDESRPAASSELDEQEWLFLEEAGINWPVSLKTLERVWREVAFAAHPDRHANDPSAQLRFVRLKNAFERLKARLDANS